ncbi:hypothetical protein TNCT_500121 [Trichonephila clavata]|uniref:Uncharacterized protein n=1 Tax=Trichonephila clavata TaxID=2740835 RepID=A0A8X6LEX6_TRICU|nr:hypothetical protein TNCT_500121 [Trichonephila clavata]
MEHRLSDMEHRLLDLEHRLSDLEKLFKRYENMKEDGNVDLHANKIITKKKGPPSPSIPEPSFPVPLATREFGNIITKRKVITKRRVDLVKFWKIITKRKVITRRRVELLPVGGSPKKPEIGFQERQTVPQQKCKLLL